MELAVLITLFVVPGTVAALKHRWLLFAAGLLFGPAIWWIAVVLTARPNSWWYVHVYDDERRARVDHDRTTGHTETGRQAQEALARLFRRH
jgi:hypothetical protein